MPDDSYLAVDPTAVLPKKRDIIERIMTQHWGMAACGCWVCVAGTAAGCRPRDSHLEGKPGVPPLPQVRVEGPHFLRYLPRAVGSTPPSLKRSKRSKRSSDQEVAS